MGPLNRSGIIYTRMKQGGLDGCQVVLMAHIAFGRSIIRVCKLHPVRFASVLTCGVKVFSNRKDLMEAMRAQPRRKTIWETSNIELNRVSFSR